VDDCDEGSAQPLPAIGTTQGADRREIEVTNTAEPAGLDGEQFCYLETIGRITGCPHTVEMWFAGTGQTLYLLAGGRDRADWVRNLQRQPRVRVRIGGTTVAAAAEVVADPAEDRRARELLSAKYYGWRGGPLPNDWARTALAIALRLDAATWVAPSGEASGR
jgi:deazaflavin-dependent oxidoreductase (nitroreductase family)